MTGGLTQDVFSSKYLLGEKPCFKHKKESETDILHAFLWATAWSGIHLNQILLLLCLRCGRTNQKGPEKNPYTAGIRSCLMWIQAERTEEHPQIMCSMFKETTVSLRSPPPPFHQRQHAMMVGEWAWGDQCLRFKSGLLCLFTMRSWVSFLLSKSPFPYVWTRAKYSHLSKSPWVMMTASTGEPSCIAAGRCVIDVLWSCTV